MTKSDLITVGKIRGVHGVNGWLKVESLSDNPNRFLPGNKIEIQKHSDSYEIEDIKDNNGRMILKFKEINDRNSAEMLNGLYLYGDKNIKGSLPEGTYYYWQLEGLEVYENGNKIGDLVSVLPGYANDNYVTRKANGKEILIPALKSVIKKVDLVAGIMEVEIPAGLDE